MNRASHPGYLGLERHKGISLCPGVAETHGGLYLTAAEGCLMLDISFILIWGNALSSAFPVLQGSKKIVLPVSILNLL